MRYFKATFFHRGQKEEVIFKSLNKFEAISDAKKFKKGIVVKVEEIPMPLEERLKVFTDIFRNRVMKKKINLPAYISALRQLGVMLKAGISLKDSLEDIGNNSSDPLVKEIFLEAANAIDSGKALSDVFAEYEEYVGGLSLALVRLGEKTGDLVMAINYLADIYENMYENRKKMIKALRYPIITLIAIAAAFVILITVVVPKFKSIFEQLHADLPLPTKMLLGAEYILTNYGPLVFMGIMAIVVIVLFFYRTSKEFKYKVDELLLKTYLIKDIILFSSLHRFLLTLSSLIRSGIPLLDALQISQDIISNEVLKKKIEDIIVGIKRGRKFAQMLAEVNLVNFIALRMISAGEESGELDTMIENAAKYYEDRFQAIIDNMQAAIEPIMLAVIGALVLWIALGIFLPMWNLASAVKGA